MSADKISARELVLFIENDGQLYHSQFVPIVKNLRLKMAKGVYDPEKAVKLWMYLMDAGAKKYVRDFGGGTWNLVFSVATRQEAAREFNQSFLTEARLGNYDHHLPKKYQVRK